MRSEWRCLGQWETRDKGKKKGKEEILQICPVLRIVFINICHQLLHYVAYLSPLAGKNCLSVYVMK